MKIVNRMTDWIGLLIILFLSSAFMSTYLIQPTRVSGDSMSPTLYDQQRIYVAKWVRFVPRVPAYGEIVIIDSRLQRPRTMYDDVVESPLYQVLTRRDDKDHIWIKRVIGRPGDILEFKDHKVYRNGRVLRETYIKETMLYTSDEAISVPKDHLFVMGDNRNDSRDSRDIGCIPLDHLIGVKIGKD